MSQKEADRAIILKQVSAGKILLKEAADLMSLSYTQAKRLWARYKKEGMQALISKKRGRSSNRAVSEDEKKRIASIIADKYFGFKPLFISEKLKEYDEIEYSSEFIRQLMIKFQLWFPKQPKQKAYPRRDRRSCEGELIQIDASDHDWFGGRAPKCHLHLLVDDATKKIEGGHFAPEETTEGYFRACLPYFKKQGRPISLYSDKRGTFLVNQGKQRGETQFARAMRELGIEMIIAHSPQAKGRIERAFGVLQERLVWEMELRNISSLEEANAYLPTFIDEYNKKFSEQPANSFNAHRPLDQKMDLKYILCVKESRKVTKNLEISYKNLIYQIQTPKDQTHRLKGSRVTVITTLEKEVLIEHKGSFLKYETWDNSAFWKRTQVA